MYGVRDLIGQNHTDRACGYRTSILPLHRYSSIDGNTSQTSRARSSAIQIFFVFGLRIAT